ncbi:DNA-binding domain superfamily [Sesbania bispinosa]|nr:DNA-binding domain superfamily [Sesbania bispinosa]
MNIFRSFDELNYSYGEASSSSETSSSNNRRRCATHSDEEVILASAMPKKRAGRRIFKETRHPVYRGVRRRNKNKWVCEMRIPNNNKSRIWLGTYPTPEMAARAHDVAALALRGKSACLNFADSAWRLTLPASTDAEEIRRAAVEAAELCAAEDNQLQQSVKDITVDYEFCSVEDHMVMEDTNKPMQQQGMYVEEAPAVSEFEKLLLSIADEPLLSPPPCARNGWDWNDVDIFDAEVSLWNFSI